MNQCPTLRLLDKIAEHLLGDFEVGDHPVFQWLNHSDLAWRAPQHLFGLFADRLHFTGAVVEVQQLCVSFNALASSRSLSEVFTSVAAILCSLDPSLTALF